MSEKSNKLSVCSLGVAMGVTYGLSLLIMGLLATFCQWGNAVVELLSTMYIGYGATVVGSVIGALWGLVDGFIFGAVIAWIYNCCNKCCGTKCCPFSKKTDEG